MLGIIHSKESFGTVDGPGLRYVLFLKGCPMRCIYCHNPDTWEQSGGEKITADEVISEIIKNRAFYENGGITVSGGEPLLQIDFLIELFQKAKAENIHTCIDTSGITFDRNNLALIKKFDKLLNLTDLVMLDIKHIDPVKHKELTGKDNKNILEFAKFLEERNTPLWVRHVVLEGYTDDQIYLEKLGEFIGKLKNLKALDVIPYHTFGVSKYEKLGIKYPISNINALSKEKLLIAKKHILEGIKKARSN